MDRRVHASITVDSLFTCIIIWHGRTATDKMMKSVPTRESKTFQILTMKRKRGQYRWPAEQREARVHCRVNAVKKLMSAYHHARHCETTDFSWTSSCLSRKVFCKHPAVHAFIAPEKGKRLPETFNVSRKSPRTSWFGSLNSIMSISQQREKRFRHETDSHIALRFNTKRTCSAQAHAFYKSPKLSKTCKFDQKIEHS